MADFLSRLAARALGAVPVAQPVIPSAFAPGMELDSGPDSPWFEAQVVDNVQASSNFLDAPSNVAVDAVQVPEGETRRHELRIDTEETQTETRESAAVDSTPARPEPAHLRSAHLPAAPYIAPTRREPRKAPVTAAVETRLFVDAGLQNDVSRRAAPSASSPQNIAGDRSLEALRQRPSAPLQEFDSGPQPVHITIGRVEVRALHQVPPVARSASSPPRPAVTLEEYGKRRNRGGQ